MTAVFVGANPRNNLRLEVTFAAVEMLSGGGEWTQVRSDANWSLVYTWARDDTVLGTSHVTIQWESEGAAEAETYRICYYGDSKGLGWKITAFEGVSGSLVCLEGDGFEGDWVGGVELCSVLRGS